jgi:Spy/CpxP family protein refolding chaperone
MRLRTSLLVAAALLLAAPATAQPSYRLQLEKPEWLRDGRLVVMGGVSDPKGHRVFLEHLSILQPVTAVLWTLDDADDVELALAKDRFDDIVVAGRSGGQGGVVHQVRTEGDLRFIVRAAGEPKPYRMLVWVGDEVRLPVSSVLTRGAPATRPWTTYAIAGLAALGLCAAVVLWGRRRGAGAAVLLLAVAWPAWPGAQSGPVRIAPQDVIWTASGAEFAAPPPVDSAGAARGGGWPVRLEGFDARWSRTTKQAKVLNQMRSGTIAALEWWKMHNDFIPDDSRFRPDYDPAGSPSLPVSCGVWDAAAGGCVECYEQAQARLNGIRHNLERLRAVYESTKRYVDASVAFGDNVSGIHGAMGLAWHAERRGIMASFQKLEKTHEAKRQEMMAVLRSALEELAACEALYFNNPDWYSRFGFMYYQFMDARYRR